MGRKEGSGHTCSQQVLLSFPLTRSLPYALGLVWLLLFLLSQYWFRSGRGRNEFISLSIFFKSWKWSRYRGKSFWVNMNIRNKRYSFSLFVCCPCAFLSIRNFPSLLSFSSLFLPLLVHFTIYKLLLSGTGTPRGWMLFRVWDHWPRLSFLFSLAWLLYLDEYLD